jgi:hypothetical protein
MPGRGSQRSLDEVRTVAFVLVKIERVTDSLRIELLRGVNAKTRRLGRKRSVHLNGEDTGTVGRKIESVDGEAPPLAKLRAYGTRKDGLAERIFHIETCTAFQTLGHQVGTAAGAQFIADLIYANESVFGTGCGGHENKDSAEANYRAGCPVHCRANRFHGMRLFSPSGRRDGGGSLF